VSGASVSFAILEQPIGAQNAALTTNQTTTNASGIAESFFTLGTKLGQYKVVVSSNAQPSQLDFIGTATTPGPPNAIQTVGGNNQSGTVGQTLTDSVKVKLIDQYENPITGSTIQFLTLGEGDNVIPTSMATTGNGIARTQWTLGQQVQQYHLLARLPSPLILSDTLLATANPADITSIQLVDIRGVPSLCRSTIQSKGNGSI
jgi:hypothetical protein